MKKPKTILLWGDLCIDHNDIKGKKISSPGGSSFYCSKIFKELGWKPIIISPRGKDYNKDWLNSTKVYPEDPQTENTLIYQNNYNQRGERTLFSKNRQSAFFIDPSSVPETYIKEAEGIVVCPIDNNVGLQHIKDLRQRMGKEKTLACLPQGFFRSYKENGEVYQDNWKKERDIVPLLDLIFLSEEDGEDLDNKALEWSGLDAIVVITRAEKGCSVFQNKERVDFPAFEVEEIVDPVGAGDVFSAAFVYSYLKDNDVKRAARFANATAAISLAFHAQEIKLDKAKINLLLKNSQT
ncbi:MAG: hypothetical protein GF370_03760 [Candidatus Nealsonbacteria bacterium]|nr:hypothetical protein [Candidatus Nealsonbacteria bacterium]